MDYEELIATYIANRNEKARLKKEYEARCKEIDELQALIEGYFFGERLKLKLDNFKTAAGTAYKYRKTSVRTKDKHEFTGFIIENRLWNMLDARPMKASVVGWLDDCGFAPPGLTVERFDCIGFLSPGEKPPKEED